MEDRGLTLQRLGKSADGRKIEGNFYGTERFLNNGCAPREIREVRVFC